MFRNYLAAALNNLSRNRLYAAISILGLAVGMAAAILTGLYIRDELSFDRFIPGYRNVYVVITRMQVPAVAPLVMDVTPVPVRAWVAQDFTGVEAAARLIAAPADVSHGDVETVETIAWVDPDFFKVLPLRTIAGDPGAAMHRPDGVVLTRSMARKYFGRDAPVGEVMQLRRDIAFRVGAVIEDLPRNSHLTEQIFASALAAASPLSIDDATPYQRGGTGPVVATSYARFASPADAARAAAGMADLVRRHMMIDGHWRNPRAQISLDLIPLDRLHLYPFGGVNLPWETPHGDPTVLRSLALIAALILAMAAVNFVNLATARAARRAIEVGVRKASGAARRDLIVQFIGEALVYSALALVCAAAIVEASLPELNAFLLRDMRFELWRDPLLLTAIVGAALAIGLASGLYPAVILSSFQPAAVLKGGAPHAAGSTLVRNGLVTLQFAVLVGLLVSTAVIVQQTRFALHDSLRSLAGQVVVMDLVPPFKPGSTKRPDCRGALVQEIRKLPGVQAAACSSLTALDQGETAQNFDLPGGGHAFLTTAQVDAGFLELYGVRPLAGRLLSTDQIDAPIPQGKTWSAPNVVINRTAMRQTGFTEPQKALGSTIRMNPKAPASVIVGVVPDFAFDIVHGPVHPLVYYEWPTMAQLSIRLTGQDVRGTLAAVDRLWARLGENRAVERHFLSQDIETTYAGVIREALFVGVLAVIAIVIAALGLFGMAAFTAERRTQEIGIRKAMGASRREIVRLLLWQFTTPVLWASLIALPIAWWAMTRWLTGFSARVALEPWLFVAAPAAALIIAWATVLTHTLKVAAEKPVNALRYE